MTTCTPAPSGGRPAAATPGDPDWDWAEIRRLCLHTARRVLGHTAAADDAAQEAAIRAWRLRHRCRTPQRPQPWVAAIARNEALRMLDRRCEQPLDDTTRDPWEADRDDFDLDAALDVRRAVGSLDGQDRQLLIGHYWQDLPNSELAVLLGVAEATIRVRLHRLRLRLRNTLVEA